MDKNEVDQVWAAFQEVAEASKGKIDPVDKAELKKDHKDRKDKDIDNDGDVDSSDEYLHKRRKVIKKAIAKKGDTGSAEKEMEEAVEVDAEFLALFEAQSPAQKAAFAKMLAGKKGGKDKDEKDEDEDDSKDDDSKDSKKPDFSKMKKEEMDGSVKPKMKKEEIKGSQTQVRALAGIKAQPKSKVSLAPAPWDKKKKPAVKASYNYEHVERVMDVLEGSQPNATGGKPESMEDKLTPSDKKMVQDHGGLGGADSGIDGAKAAADTAASIKASEPSKTTEKPTGMKEETNLASFFQSLRAKNT